MQDQKSTIRTVFIPTFTWDFIMDSVEEIQQRIMPKVFAIFKVILEKINILNFIAESLSMCTIPQRPIFEGIMYVFIILITNIIDSTILLHY
jgi:hypothetical protein